MVRVSRRSRRYDFKCACGVIFDGVIALNRVEPNYGWFTQRFDTANLREAKALLDELF